MIPRTLEPEVMDSDEEALTYDHMDHRDVNARFVSDLLAVAPSARRVLDLGAGTALIPIELASRAQECLVTAVDLAPSMLRQGAHNVARAGLVGRISLVVASASDLPYAAGDFDAVVSNSLVHHVPNPGALFRSAARVAGGRATVFIRDLCRPDTEQEVEALVERYASGESEAARELFRASLRASLTIEEVRDAVEGSGLSGASVTMTSDRHWTLVRAAS